VKQGRPFVLCGARQDVAERLESCALGFGCEDDVLHVSVIRLCMCA
jgi:hypothetical protein